MLEQLKYENHLGEILNFGDYQGFYVNVNSLHDFNWDVISVNDRISGFDKGIQEYTVPIRIACASRQEGLRKRNQLFEIPEKDVLRGQYGRLWINGYYCECYVTASKKSFYSMEGRYMACDVTITTDKPFWIKEVSTFFEPIEESEHESTYLEFPYDFAYDYKADDYQITVLNNTGFFESKFRMIINGPVINPTIHIGDHMYQVNVTVEDNSYLTIDSMAQKIYLTTNDGTIINAFDERNRDSYIFQPIPTGRQDVTWDNSFSFAVALLEERSEPAWTIPEFNEDWEYYINENGYLVEGSPYDEESGFRFFVSEDGQLYVTFDSDDVIV